MVVVIPLNLLCVVIWVLLHLRLVVPMRRLFFNINSSAIVHALINVNIHFFNKNAVSGHDITLLNINYVTNNERARWNLSLSGVLASEHDHLLFVDLFSDFEKLVLFCPISDGANKCCKECTTEDCETLGLAWRRSSIPVPGGCLVEGQRRIERAGNEQGSITSIFKLRSKKFKETSHGWKWEVILAEQSGSRLQISLISGDTGDGVRIQQLAEPMMITALFQ